MNSIHTLLLSCLLASLPCTGQGQEKHPPKDIVSPGKSLSIRQQFEGDNFKEVLSFPGKKLAEVSLDEDSRFSFPWAGEYLFSPDEQWMLRIQKTGSGENMVFLYRVEGNGRLSRVTGFDARLWEECDKVSPMKKESLFHTGTDEIHWSDDSKSIVIQMRGTTDVEPIRSMEATVTCDLANYQFRVELPKN